jgi:hypothetical protein
VLQDQVVYVSHRLERPRRGTRRTGFTLVAFWTAEPGATLLTSFRMIS